MKLSRLFSLREKVLMIILAVLLLAALYVFTVHMPVSNGIQEANMMTEELDLQNTILEAKTINLSQMKKEIDNLDPNAPSVPEYDNLKNVMAFLNETLTSTDDYTLNFSQLNTDENTGIVRRSCQLTFKCDSYEQAEKVIETLESYEYVCQISNLVIENATENSKRAAPITDGQVKVSVTATFFERAF